MATDSTGALNAAPGSQRIALLITLLAWWSWLLTLIWVCFLREGPRSLASTVHWFSQPGIVTAAITLALALAGLTLLLPRGGSARIIGGANLFAAALQGLLISPAMELLTPLP